MNLSGKNVVVVGLGKSGLAAARLLLDRGARVTVVDDKPTGELPVIAGVKTRSFTRDSLVGAELLVVSPGVPLARAELQGLRGKMIGEIELAYTELAARGGRFIGITGTNGKSTTTALTGELMQKTGKRVFVGGNLGRPLAEAALESQPYDYYVVELSSFQLEGIETARFQSAAILNLTPDHLDRYVSHLAYGEAKTRILMNQTAEDFAVFNADDEFVRPMAEKARGRVAFFSLKSGGDRYPVLLPLGDDFVLKLDECVIHEFKLRNRALRGRHNMQNAMAAAYLAISSGASPAQVQAGLDSYPGLPHRLEFVRNLDGVEWINDSKATNVDSSLVALAAFKSGLWVIAGGKGKGAPYQPMVDASRGKVKGVLTIGKDAPTIEDAYRGVTQVLPCGTLESAVKKARELAREGDTVLLSPACASYDQFKNFEDRGDQFKKMVMQLEDRGLK